MRFSRLPYHKQLRGKDVHLAGECRTYLEQEKSNICIPADYFPTKLRTNTLKVIRHLCVSF
jgi:hypothetical protein